MDTKPTPRCGNCQNNPAGHSEIYCQKCGRNDPRARIWAELNESRNESAIAGWTRN